MISTGDAEFPRDYHTLGGGGTARRFPESNNGGPASSLDRRHTSIATKSLEALTNIHKADIERQRDAFMDPQKNKYPNSPSNMSQGSAPCGRQQVMGFCCMQKHINTYKPLLALGSRLSVSWLY